MRSSFLSLVDITQSSFGLSGVKLNVNKLSRLKERNLIIRIKPNILKDWEKIQSTCAWKCISKQVLPQGQYGMENGHILYKRNKEESFS
jgi:hypothetical protein